MKTITTAIVLFCSLSSFAQTLFEKVFTNYQGAAYAREDGNGDLYVLFSSAFVKMDPSATNTILTKSYPYQNMKFEFLSNGNLMFAGCDYMHSTVFGLMDPSFDTLKTTSFTGGYWYNSQTKSLAEDPNGDLYFLIHEPYGSHMLKYMVKFNGQLDSITANMNGGEDFFPAANSDVLVVKNDLLGGFTVYRYDSTFNILWSQVQTEYFNPTNGYFAHVINESFSDSSIQIAGKRQYLQSITNYSSSGTLKNMPWWYNGIIYDFIQMESGTFAAIGVDDTAAFLCFYDSNFTKISTKHFYGLNYVEPQTMVETSDHGLLISGQTFSGLPKQYVPWIAKTDSLGNTSPVGIEENFTEGNFQIIYLDNNLFRITQHGANHMEIYDLTGKKVDEININSEIFIYDGNKFSKGNYLFTLSGKGNLKSTKKILIK